MHKESVMADSIILQIMPMPGDISTEMNVILHAPHVDPKNRDLNSVAEVAPWNLCLNNR